MSNQRKYTLDSVLSQLSCPLLLVWGDLDPWVGPAKALRIKEFYPQTSVVNLQAGHCPHDEVPELVNKALLDWLPTLPSSPSPQHLWTCSQRTFFTYKNSGFNAIKFFFVQEKEDHDIWMVATCIKCSYMYSRILLFWLCILNSPNFPLFINSYYTCGFIIYYRLVIFLQIIHTFTNISLTLSFVYGWYYGSWDLLHSSIKSYRFSLANMWRDENIICTRN